MLQRDHYPAGVPCWVDAAFPDAPAATRFYGGLFGWEFEDRIPADVPGHYFIARLDGLVVAALASQPDEPEPEPTAWHTYVAVDDADDTATRAETAGGRVLVPPTDVFEQGRMAVLEDPAGATIRAWQPGRRTGAQLVNAPGSWNWSDLNSNDIAAAEAFYAAVFGWETEKLDFGYGESWMWRRPGYGDFLATIDPGLRARHAESGVPAGFSDAVGWLQPLTDPATPPHWSVTFAVDGTAAAVDRAVELGGTVVQPVVDAGVSSYAVVRDPQGAQVTLSTYTP
ncbi:MAG: VOC family protein [Streptosporangiales bacterium]|nr:VOC family protein [Streptosporangiales bacterium]